LHPLSTSEISRLYLKQSAGLQRHVRSVVRAPGHVIDDACHHAWVQLVDHRDRVGAEAAYGWLVATAVRQAIKLCGVWEREVSLDAELENQGEMLLARTIPAALPDEIAQRRERLAQIGGLPRRQQRMLWLRGLGLSPLELADHEQCTLRTVDRLLCRARQQLRSQAA
jgi:DNA-directed RNA polymerase specialized sigma24 family protein